ncbi:ABC transporter substrate-binding protein [Paenibacillus sp. E194]|uniref:extracellular solute-binding protein n=1 Tax=Paenibacillus sp. E194 TaxID=1458845 RepID=UPI0005C87F38|nr:extracellular solute-binding protein [Paenibacillus sp. E194]KJB88922.1 ABC transporter substrate-binding protein [Paenibacillus sp. E194]
MRSRKWFTLTLSVVLSFSLLVTACGGGGGGAANEGNRDERVALMNKEGMPIAKDKMTMTAFAGKFFASSDWSKLMLWQEYEKMSNIHIEWETVQVDSLKEKRNIKLAGGDYPEMFFASALPKTDLIKYGSQGTFLRLNDLIDQYAPNFKKIMEQYPIVKKGITMPDGSIYGFPTIFDPEFKSLFYGTPWMKQEWLDNVGMKAPTNLDELVQVLKAFKEKDPNKNGKQDEIPWGSRGVSIMINFLRGPFGLSKNGIANPNVDLDPATGKLRFVQSTDEYKQLLQYVAKLYKDGLLDKETFTMKDTDITSKASAGLYGFLDGVDPKAVYNQDGYVGMPVIQGVNGEKQLTNIGSPLGNLGMFVLTDKAKNPEAAIRWIDHFYGDEGAKMFFMGFEGVTYQVNDKGDYEYLDAIKNNKDGLNLDQAISQYLTWPGGYYPGIVKQKFFKGAEGYPSSVKNAQDAEPFSVKMEDVWPSFNFTPEEQEELTTIQTDIQTYIDEMRDKFASGAAGFDQWDAYVKQLEQMNVKRYLEIYEAAYERYKGGK